MRDLEHQLDEARAKMRDAASIDAVAAAAASRSPSPTAIAVGRSASSAIADDGSEIVYEGDAALGKAAPIDR